MANNKTYETGYARPPKETQFKKGQSGNPLGRPKATRNLKPLFEDVMLEEVEYTENGRKRRRPALELVFLRLRQRALKDDTKAMELILRHFQQFGMSQPDAEPIAGLLDEDKAILEEFAEQAATATKRPPGATGTGGKG